MTMRSAKMLDWFLKGSFLLVGLPLGAILYESYSIGPSMLSAVCWSVLFASAAGMLAFFIYTTRKQSHVETTNEQLLLIQQEFRDREERMRAILQKPFLDAVSEISLALQSHVSLRRRIERKLMRFSKNLNQIRRPEYFFQVNLRRVAQILKPGQWR